MLACLDFSRLPIRAASQPWGRRGCGNVMALGRQQRTVSRRACDATAVPQSVTPLPARGRVTERSGSSQSHPPTGGWLTTGTLRSHDRLSRPALQPDHASTTLNHVLFVVRLWSSVVQKMRNRFRPLSEFSAKLSPRWAVDVESGHRRTKREIMTSDWCSEAGWFGCRSGAGQAGKV